MPALYFTTQNSIILLCSGRWQMLADELSCEYAHELMKLPKDHQIILADSFSILENCQSLRWSREIKGWQTAWIDLISYENLKFWSLPTTMFGMYPMTSWQLTLTNIHRGPNKQFLWIGDQGYIETSFIPKRLFLILIPKFLNFKILLKNIKRIVKEVKLDVYGRNIVFILINMLMLDSSSLQTSSTTCNFKLFPENCHVCCFCF